MRKSTLARWTMALAVCALSLPMGVSAKDQVERPFKFRNDFTTVNYTPFPGVAVLEGTGRATHLGSLTAEGVLVRYVEPGVALFRGSFTSANGDEIFWDAYVSPGVSYTVFFTGGTGRFQNASGGFEAVYTYRIMEPYPPVPGTDVLVTFGSEGTGTIKY
ncbi:MAG: hypothetical protein KJ072_28670 [Verrucomicrobia bacterium]|nr:hypothetical protein [Verrucomicrobiota bacterium]